MRRIVFTGVLVAVVALPAAAVAKGPHATVSSLPVGIEPGQPWTATLTLAEYREREAATARPTVILRSGADRITAAPRPSRRSQGSQYAPAEARYRLRVVFPRAGRWAFTVLDGTGAERRFRFPPAVVGADSDRRSGGWIAFPDGSPEKAAGAGGPLIGDAGPTPVGPGKQLPPEVIMPPAGESDGGGGGAIPWMPAVGLTLAGVGGVAVLRRVRRRPGNR
jgi:hypothetical protein